MIFPFTGSSNIFSSFFRLHSLSTTASWTWCSSSSPSSGECQGVTLSGSCHRREFSPPSTVPTFHICSATAAAEDLWGIMWLQKSLCVLSSSSFYVRCGYLWEFAPSSHDSLRPASRCHWPSGQHSRMMSSVEDGASGSARRVRHYLGASALGTCRARGLLLTSALQLKTFFRTFGVFLAGIM